MRLSNSEIKDLVINYFPNLGEEEIDLFLSITRYKRANNKELILKIGKPNNILVFILKGVARAYNTNEKGQELNNYIRAEGHLMGDAKTFGNEALTLSIEAIGEIHYLKLDMIEFENLGYENPKLMKFYLSFLKEIILTLSYRLNTFVTMSSEERYLDLIKWNPILIETAFDKHIASFLGITPLTIHRIKKKLKSIN
jgi:CRP-like cAMP-binding protein